MERESPAERTDPLLPVITADFAPPFTPPALDDRRLAGLLAELDADENVPVPRPAEDVREPSPAADVPRPAENLPVPRRAEPTPPRVEPTPPRAEPHPLPPVVESTVIDQGDAMSLTGLSRVGESRVGTVLFTMFFLGIFLLIVIEVVVSLVLRASS